MNFKSNIYIIKNKIFLLIYFVFVVSNMSFGQNDFSKVQFDLDIRERFELWNGMNAKNYGDNSSTAVGSLEDKMLLQRIIAGFVLHPTSSIDISAHLQDSRAFGWSLRDTKYPNLFKVKAKNTQEPYYIMNPNEEFFEIHDLNVEYRDLLKNLTITIGRQKISYGENRVFGPGEWGNTGRWTWDALKLSYKDGSNFIDILGGGTKVHDPHKISIPFSQTEFWGGGLYAHYALNKVVNIEPFYAIKKLGSADYAQTLDFTSHWAGIRFFNNDFHHFVYDVTFNKEFGEERGKTIDAYGILAKLGYQFSSLPFKPILCIRESYASGGKSTDIKIKTFDPVYGSKDSYYGRMNITSWSNLDDREIFVILFPANDMKIEINYHWFYIPVPDDVLLLGTLKLEFGKYHLGNEFNIYANYQILNQLQIVSVFGYFSPYDVQLIKVNKAKDAKWFAFQMEYELN